MPTKKKVAPRRNFTPHLPTHEERIARNIMGIVAPLSYAMIFFVGIYFAIAGGITISKSSSSGGGGDNHGHRRREQQKEKHQLGTWLTVAGSLMAGTLLAIPVMLCVVPPYTDICAFVLFLVQLGWLMYGGFLLVKKHQIQPNQKDGTDDDLFITINVYVAFVLMALTIIFANYTLLHIMYSRYVLDAAK